jgi:hypothetical protein
MVSALPASDTVARLVLENTLAHRLGHLAGEALVIDEHVPLAVVATLIGCDSQTMRHSQSIGSHVNKSELSADHFSQ